ncbi:hypothetical protein LCGC14_2841930, partial [marine sediment metagenome]
AETARAVLGALGSAGVEFTAVDDLCELAARGDPLLGELAGAEELTVVACYPRAVKWLFAAAGAPLSDGRVQMLNMRTQPAGEIIQAVTGGHPAPAEACCPPTDGCCAPANECCAPASEAATATGADWAAWFPVIDRDRCVDCKQCMNFCLFGTYEADGPDKVVVANPRSCKTNCPACARVCPTAAIIFPKHDRLGVIAGEVPTDADMDAQKVRLDMNSLLSGDPLETLRNRSKGGAAAALKVLQELGVPDDVIASSGEEIARRCSPARPCCDPPDRPCCPEDA